MNVKFLQRICLVAVMAGITTFTACSNGNTSKDNMIQNDAMRDTTNSLQTPETQHNVNDGRDTTMHNNMSNDTSKMR